MHRFPDWSRRTAILLFWLFLWHLASLAVQNQILLVGPLDALKALAVQLASPASWGALWFSFGRISLGFFMAFLAGLLTGSLAFWKPLAGEILEPAIQFMKSVPVASFVILALIWTGAENLSVFISFLVVYPVIQTPWPDSPMRIRVFWKWPGSSGSRSGGRPFPSTGSPCIHTWKAL